MNKNKIYMVIDIDRCWGCKACEIACKQELEIGLGTFPMRVMEIGPRIIEDKLHRDFVPTMCQHCDEAPCMDACPMDAIFREIDGTVQIDNDKCVSCGLCEKQCPYGVIKLNETKTPIKCTLCFDRRKASQLPSCVQHCPGRAITIIEAEQLILVVEGRYYWKTGRIVYVSSKWSKLGKDIKPSIV